MLCKHLLGLHFMTYAPSALVNPSASSQRGILWAGGVDTLDSLLNTCHTEAATSSWRQVGAGGTEDGTTSPVRWQGSSFPDPEGTVGQRARPRPRQGRLSPLRTRVAMGAGAQKADKRSRDWEGVNKVVISYRCNLFSCFIHAAHPTPSTPTHLISLLSY